MQLARLVPLLTVATVMACTHAEPLNTGNHGRLNLQGSTIGAVGYDARLWVSKDDPEGETCVIISRNCSPDQLEPTRIASARCLDPEVCEVRVDAPDQVQVRGLAPGKTQVEVVAEFAGIGEVVDTVDVELLAIETLDVRCFIGCEPTEAGAPIPAPLGSTSWSVLPQGTTAAGERYLFQLLGDRTELLGSSGTRVARVEGSVFHVTFLRPGPERVTARLDDLTVELEVEAGAVEE